MGRVFKNALCLVGLPDACGYLSAPYHLQCKRRDGHTGKHRVKFADGRYRTWSDGDTTSRVVKRP